MLIEPLKTSRLILAPVCEKDASWLQPLMEMPAVNTSTLVVPTPCPPGFACEWVELAVSNNLSGKAYTFSLFLEKDNCPIGTIFLIVNTVHCHAELGYFLNPAFWNKGFCSEASAEMVQFAFKSLGLNRVFAVYFSSNPSSGQVMKKIGMQYEGCRRKHIVKCDVFQDIEQYGMLSDEWAKARKDKE
jgi:RimJ/RimL family protein N-acetyltransferase